MDVKFEIETNIPMSKVDLEEGKRHQVRLEVDPDTALRYGMKMEQEPDCVFNMVILQKEKNRYWPWSGNQRLQGFTVAAVSDTLDAAYVVQIHDPAMMDLLPRVVNTWEAVSGMTKSESIHNARHMVEKHGMSVVEAARLFSLKPDQVYKQGRVDESKKFLQNLGISSSQFSPTTLDALGRIENLNARRRTAKLLHEYKVKGTDALNVINDVRESNTEAQQIVTLEKWESAFQLRISTKTRTKTVKTSGIVGSVNKLPYKEMNRERLVKCVTSLARLCEQCRTVTQAQLTDPAHREVVAKLWNTTIVPTMNNILGGK
jgi:hypothetical protein